MTSRIAISMLVWGMFVGCGEAADVGDRSHALAVAKVSESVDSTLVIFSTEQSVAALDDVASGADPKSFRWVSIAVPSSDNEALYSDIGFVADLANATPPVVFAQVYRDVCNPAAEDFSGCWLLERYTSGQEGLSGSIRLRLTDTTAEGHFGVAWEGITDRFAGQPQWHRHETSISAAAVIKDEPLK